MLGGVFRRCGHFNFIKNIPNETSPAEANLIPQWAGLHEVTEKKIIASYGERSLKK